MKAESVTPRDLFEGRDHYEIPAFQRPYVWNEEDQWAPLWEDVRRVAQALVGKEADAASPERRHFLGAVVTKALPSAAGGVTRYSVIDGQQRMTTLQLLLDAAQAAVEDLGHDEEAEDLAVLVLNRSKRLAGQPERFKVWPSRADRAAFEAAMDPVASSPPADFDARPLRAHRYFRERVMRWLVGDVEEAFGDVVGTQDERAHALSAALQDRLGLVAITLDESDDDQLIFETLNDRGTPLLSADLVKNWVFQRGHEAGADVEHWAASLWLELDDDWWRDEVRQGRTSRARLDIFFQYWLTARTREEVPTEQVFRRFAEHAKPLMSDVTEADAFLRRLTEDARVFRDLAGLDAESSAGRFYGRVVESLELASTTPVLLWLLSPAHRVPAAEVDTALSALESWAVRRTLLRRPTAGINRLMVVLLRHLDAAGAGSAGAAVQQALVDQTLDSTVWPSDDDVRADLPSTRLYGQLRRERIQVLLSALEVEMRSGRHEAVALPAGLQVEHVMPRVWRSHWDTEPPLSPERAGARDRLVDTLGNLTLVSQKLNASLSNRPWRDDEAERRGDGGQLAGKGKRSLLQQWSLLALNAELTTSHPDAWTDDDIRRRGEQLAELACRCWPRPTHGS